MHRIHARPVWTATPQPALFRAVTQVMNLPLCFSCQSGDCRSAHNFKDQSVRVGDGLIRPSLPSVSIVCLAKPLVWPTVIKTGLGAERVLQNSIQRQVLDGFVEDLHGDVDRGHGSVQGLLMTGAGFLLHVVKELRYKRRIPGFVERDRSEENAIRNRGHVLVLSAKQRKGGSVDINHAIASRAPQPFICQHSFANRNESLPLEASMNNYLSARILGRGNAYSPIVRLSKSPFMECEYG